MIIHPKELEEKKPPKAVDLLAQLQNQFDLERGEQKQSIINVNEFLSAHCAVLMSD